MKYSKNAQYNGRCARLVLLPDGTEVIYINDRGEFNIEPVGAPSCAQARQMAKRRAQMEGVTLEVLTYAVASEPRTERHTSNGTVQPALGKVRFRRSSRKKAKLHSQ